MLRLRKFNRLCSRTVSDPANRLRKHGRKNPLPFPISKRSHIGNLRQISKQGKGRSSKRKGNRRCPFLFAPPRRAPRRSCRPQTANPPLRFSGKLPAPLGRTRYRSSCAPVSRCRKKEPPREGRTRLRQFARPSQPVQKKSRPLGANTLTQFVCPGFPVQEKGEDAKSNGETVANFVYCYKIAQNRSVLLEMTGAKC